MKKNYLIFSLSLFFIFSLNGYGQLNTGGQPYSFNKLDLSKTEVLYKTMPGIDVNQLLMEDEINSQYKDIPWRFGESFDVDYDLNNSGTWDKFPNGDRIWRLGIQCQGAYSINLLFDNYYLPAGAKLYIYNTDESHVIGAFTERNNQDDKLFATTLVKGDAIVIEYYEPANSKFQGELSLGTITHAYKDVYGYVKAFGGSGSCNVNVACPQSAGWEDEINSAVHYITGSYVCSGAMINNADDDGTPYFLTADHCYSTPGALVFWFNWESTTCTNPGSSPTHNTLSGAVQRARNSDSDFWLVELNDRPQDNSIDVFYAGWNRQDAAMSSSVCIHHPSGDIKKISFDNNAYSSDLYLGTSGISGSHWKVTDWDDGTTEGGSSGSPLFDPNHRIVGQLHGGYAACGNNDADWYGKLSMSWDYGGSSSTQLEDWLDPSNTGNVVIDGFDPSSPTALTANFSGTPTTVVPGNTVTFTNLSSGPNPITSYTWSFPGGTPSSANTAGPHAITYNTLGNYNVSLTVGDGSTTDSEVKTNYINVTNCNYCASTYSNTTDDWINNVTFNTINNNSGQGGATSYEDFTSISTDIAKGSTYPISVDLTMNGNWTEHVWVWIDWNQNCDFTDPGESFDLGDVTNTGSVSGSILVPVGAATGVTRMRIIEEYNADPLSCDAHPTTYGETEDYSVNVTPAGAPANDICSSAQTIGIVTDQAYSTSLANDEGVAVTCGTGGMVDIWYVFTSPGDGTLTIDTDGSLYDTRLAVWSSCGGTELGCDDDGGTGTTSLLSLAVTNGTNYYIQVGGYSSNVGDGDITIAFTASTNCISTYPYTQSFDGWSTSSPAFSCTADGTVTLGDNWTNVTGDDIDWDIFSGSTGSGSTGPTTDHTSGSGNYLYTETSSCYTSTGYIISPCFDLSSISSPELSFWYHMYGATMGTMSVQVSTDGGGSWSADLWSLSGDQTNNWYEATVDLTAYSTASNVIIRWTGLTGTSYTSDMAIDDITIDGSVVIVNDLCSGAIAISEVIDLPFDSSPASASGMLPSCGGVAPFDLWYAYTATLSGTAIFDLCGSGYDTRLTIWDGCSGLELACNDDNGPACTGLQSSIALAVASGTTYYVQIGGYETNSGTGDLTIQVYIPGLWTGTSSNDWGITTNWDDGVVPIAGTEVTIPTTPTGGNFPETNSGAGAECNDLTIEAGAQLYIPSDNTLTVNGMLTNNAGIDGLVVKSDVGGTASLIHNTSGVNATVERYLTDMEWHFIGIPVSSASAGVFHLPFGHSDIYLRTHNEATNTWGIYIVPVVTPLILGRGYDTWVGDPVGIQQPETLEFKGILNSGDYITGTGGFYGLQYTSGHGLNLISNPYPSALEADIDTWSKNNVDNSVWIWDDAAGNYVYWNGADGSNGQGWGTMTGGIIPSMQAFFVLTNNSSPWLTIPQTNRVHSTQAFYKNSFIPANTLKLNVSGNNYEDNIFVRFTEQATDGYDGQFDVKKIHGLNEAPQLYSFIPGDILSINSLSEYEGYKMVNLGFECATPTTFTITASELESFEEYIVIYLEDLKEGALHNLNNNAEYTFYHEMGDDPNRFILHFGEPSGIGDLSQQNVRIYSNDNVVYIQKPESIKGDVIVYDMVGQEILRQKVGTATLEQIRIDKGTGYYLVRLQSDDIVVTEKVFIK